MLDRLRHNKSLCIATTLFVLVCLGFAWIWSQLAAGTRDMGFISLLLPTHTSTPTITPTPTPSPTVTATTTPTATTTSTPTPPATRVLSVPVILQELPLSCEFAGMRMVLFAVLGTAPSEEELLDCMPRNPNPYLGFRGDPAGYNVLADGSINWENYGAYAPVVAETLNKCVFEPSGEQFRAVAVSNASYQQVADAVLDGYPVIVWVAKRKKAITTDIDTPHGSVPLIFGEHVWVVVGYHEDGTFDVHDPYPQKSGVQTFRVSSFPSWDLFDRMAVFIVSRETTPSGTQGESQPIQATTTVTGTVTQIRPNSTVTTTLALTPTASPTSTPTTTPRPRASSPPTRICIPKINVDADVVEVEYKMAKENGETMASWKVADYAAGFHRGSAYPGHPGNTVIAGHNNIRGRVFRHLLDLLPGDNIYLYVDKQEFHYVVTQRLLFKEKGMPWETRLKNAKWIQPTDDERLTLISCWPFIKPDHRVVIIAKPK